MALEAQIQDDMKTAMRAGDALKRDTLRMLIAAMKNERIAVGADLSEDQAQAVIRRGVKSRKDSAQQYRDAGRPELADKEDA
ncbi:MAG: GatB/YqeY domain-containing protein, partial [Planctomycetota bacterium]